MKIDKEQVVQMLQQVARHMTLLYISIAREVIENYGEDGKDVILKGLETFGRTRGQRIAERVKKAGKPLTIENFFEFYDVPVSLIAKPSGEANITINGKLVKKIESCPTVKLAEEEGQLEIGKLYCEQDTAMLKGYNPQLRLDKKASLMEGDECCEFVYSVPEGV